VFTTTRLLIQTSHTYALFSFKMHFNIIIQSTNMPLPNSLIPSNGRLKFRMFFSYFPKVLLVRQLVY